MQARTLIVGCRSFPTTLEEPPHNQQEKTISVQELMPIKNGIEVSTQSRPHTLKEVVREPIRNTVGGLTVTEVKDYVGRLREYTWSRVAGAPARSGSPSAKVKLHPLRGEVLSLRANS
ncbi:MAG: hypothetical protein ABJB97_08155 [Acidobacteriota bacterium]